MAICTKCGAQIEDTARFCMFCGQALAQQQQYIASAGHRALLTEKQMALRDAPYVLNRPDQPWQVTVEGESIVARWKWMDATFFSPHEVTNETRDYTFTVTLTDKQTWSEIDRSEDKSSGIKMSSGKIGFGSSSNTFIGKQSKKSFQFGVGKDNQTGQVGLVGFKFNTTPVKESIRAYLTSRGWKRRT